MDQSWVVVLGGEAERDFALIVRWTAETFGPRQAIAYANDLKGLVLALGAGPDPLGFKTRTEIGEGFRTLHLRAIGRRGRHFVLYRVQAPEIHVVRVLHDRMELARHLPPPESE